MVENVRTLSDGTEIDVFEYRKTLGSFMTGVTVVTTVDRDGRPRGMTMNSFTSVSLDPPLLLVCVDKGAASYDAFVESRGIAIHILGADQQPLARTFASKSPDKFADLAVTPGRGGAPVIQDVHAWLDCETHEVVDAGDHAIIIGRVRAFEAREMGPLGFYQGKFNSFSADEQILQQQSDGRGRTTVRWVVETSGEQLALHGSDALGWSLPASKLSASDLSRDGLARAATALLGTDVVIDFLYSIYEGAGGEAELVYRGRIDSNGPEVSTPFQLVPTREAAEATLPDASERAVIKRYANERIGAAFGVYAGSQIDGSVAPVGQVSPDTRTMEVAQ